MHEGMQKLEVFQSIWAMERRRPDGHEWPLEEQVEMIAKAGYAGMDLLAFKPDVSRAASALLKEVGLACTVCAFPKSIDGFKQDVDLAHELAARHLNVIGQMYPMTVEEGADIVNAWLEIAGEAGVPVTFETHPCETLWRELFNRGHNESLDQPRQARDPKATCPPQSLSSLSV